MTYPSPDTPNPVTLPDGAVLPNNVFLKAVIDHPRMDIGEYTYANAFQVPQDWAAHIAPYLFPTSPDRLIIGKFGQFADGVQFITQSANHKMDGFSTYPFALHDPARFPTYAAGLPVGRDTVIGHDVWLGKNVSVMPGTQIGSGVIVGSGATVAGTIPDYAVVVGNPGRVVRMRFDPATVSALRALAWWDWPIEAILAAEAAIVGADLPALQAFAP